MSVTINEDTIRLLRDPATVRVLATSDPQGVPNAAFKGSINVDAEGRLYLLELLETSRSNRNLVHSIWFGRKVSVALRGAQGESVEIVGTPARCIVAGSMFEHYYRQVRERLGDVDLAAVWYITPLEIRDERFQVRYAQETAAHPLVLHLDRIAKKEADIPAEGGAQ